jgi:hypothetical protein
VNLQAFVEKSSDSEMLREIIGFAMQRLMELEVAGLTGACHGERSPDRLPKLCQGSYSPGFLEPRRLAEKERRR